MFGNESPYEFKLFCCSALSPYFERETKALASLKLLKNTNTQHFLLTFLLSEKTFFTLPIRFSHDAVCAERKKPKTSLSRGRKRRRLFGFIIGTICCSRMKAGLLMNGAERSRKPPAANFFIKAANFSHFVIQLLAKEGTRRGKALRRHVMKRLIVKTIQIFITQLNSYTLLADSYSHVHGDMI